jgi:hypothetical protein
MFHGLGRVLAVRYYPAPFDDDVFANMRAELFGMLL